MLWLIFHFDRMQNANTRPQKMANEVSSDVKNADVAVMVLNQLPPQILPTLTPHQLSLHRHAHLPILFPRMRNQLAKLINVYNRRSSPKALMMINTRCIEVVSKQGNWW